MSDHIEITSGGAVAVDTASLDHAASGLDSVADLIDDMARRTARVGDLLDAASTVSGGAGVLRAERVAADLDQATVRARSIASTLRDCARAYEIVELTNERDLALAAGDAPRAQAAAAQLALARAADPSAAAHADSALSRWNGGWAMATGADVWGPLFLLSPGLALTAGVLLPLAVGLRGGGLVPRGATPAGPPQPVVVAPVGAPAQPARAPGSLSALIERVPDQAGDGAARVRVETYEMPDGSRQHAVYIAGTQDFTNTSGDAFDMRSNVDLYGGSDSAAYEAARTALVMAGVEPGEALTIVGFSQGGMVASWLAQDPTYDVQALITAGAPATSDVPPDVLTLQVEHLDDIVPALQGAHDAGIQGSADSAVVRRTVDDLAGPQDLLVPAHRQDEYARTAELFEQSGDPRAAVFTAMLSDLGGATAVSVTQFSARRP